MPNDVDAEKALWLQNQQHPARTDRLLISRMWSPGVLDDDDFAVTERAAGANRSVDVAVGGVVVADTSDGGAYLWQTVSVRNAPLDAFPSSGQRIDTVMVQVNDPDDPNSPDTGDVEIVVVKGAVSSSPTPPAVPADAEPLFDIGPLDSTVAQITDASGLIVDRRRFASRRIRSVDVQAGLDGALLATRSVPAAALAANSITAAELATNAVGPSEIAANAVGPSELAEAYYTQAEVDSQINTVFAAVTGITDDLQDQIDGLQS